MKKTLLLLAVLGAFTGTASAQTNVTIFGFFVVGVFYRDNGADTNNKTWGVDSGQASGSRLGFRGTEDLGGGLAAIFTLESGVNVDDGTLGQGNYRQRKLAGLDAPVWPPGFRRSLWKFWRSQVWTAICSDSRRSRKRGPLRRFWRRQCRQFFQRAWRAY